LLNKKAGWKKLISKLAETEVILLNYLYRDSYPDQESLCRDAGVNKSTGSKALKRLKNKGLVVGIKRGKYNHLTINRSKKREIKHVLTIWEKFHDVLRDKTKILVRPHNFEAYAGCFVPKSYAKETYRKHKPKNRFCVTKKIENLGSCTINISELDSRNNSIRIFIAPFYLVVPIDVSQEDLETLINEHCDRKVNFIMGALEKEGVIVGSVHSLQEGSVAFIDDELAQLSIRHHIKNRNIDESHYLIPEYEIHAPNLVEKIYKIINLRKSVFENKISEFELAKYIENLTKDLQKW